MRQAGFASIAILLALLGSATAATADSGHHHPTFAGVVSQATLVALVGIHERPDGGYRLEVEQVLKGEAGSTLSFGPEQAAFAPFEPSWKRAVIAFHLPTQLDFRTPTIAWQVAADGTLDPSRYQQYPGVPQTLAAMRAYFGLPDTSAAGATRPGQGSAPVTWLVLVGVAGTGAASWGRRVRPANLIGGCRSGASARG